MLLVSNIMAPKQGSERKNKYIGRMSSFIDALLVVPMELPRHIQTFYQLTWAKGPRSDSPCSSSPLPQGGGWVVLVLYLLLHNEPNHALPLARLSEQEWFCHRHWEQQAAMLRADLSRSCRGTRSAGRSRNKCEAPKRSEWQTMLTEHWVFYCQDAVSMLHKSRVTSWRLLSVPMQKVGINY